MRIKAYIFRKDPDRCRSCGRKLTPTEKYYYGRSCERCESKDMKRYRK